MMELQKKRAESGGSPPAQEVLHRRVNSTHYSTPLSNAIREVMEDYPDLSSYGWRFYGPSGFNDGERFDELRRAMLSDDFEFQVHTALVALQTEMPRGYALGVAKAGSYSLKHKVEYWVQYCGRTDLSRYVSNGAFIVAAILAGWEIKRWENHPNCGFYRRPAR